MNKTFCQRLVESCESHSDRTAMRVVGDDSEVYSYAEMLRLIRSVAFRLESEGIGFGDRVALLGENHPCWAIAYLATLYRGAVSVPLDPHGETDTLANFLENSGAKLVFLSPDIKEKYSEIEKRLGRNIPAVVWRDKPEADAPIRPAGAAETFQAFEDWARTEFTEAYAKTDPPARSDDIALLMYTSGTTGTPKGVPLTHGNITAELDGVYVVLHLTEKEKILSLLPLFHAYLQIVNLWVATTYGCEVGYLKELTPSELSEAMVSFKPTMLTTVPRLWYLFHKKIFDAVGAKPKPVRALFKIMLGLNGFLRDTFKINAGPKFFGKIHDSFGGCIRFAITAGSRFDEAVALDFYKLGFTIIQGYGLTETSGAATATYEKDNRVGSVGKAFVNAEVKIASPDEHGVGEVLIRGDMVFKGYYNNPEATAQAFTPDGWFRSGDLGKFDRGQLYIVGRKKDVIVLPSGKNVHPEDIEVHYLKSPLVEEICVLGIDNDSRLAAVIVPDFAYLKANHISNSREAVRHELDNLGRDLPEYQRVRDYIVRADPLPRTATRKIKRFELQKEIESGVFTETQGRDVKTWTLSDEDRNLMSTPAGEAVAAAIRQHETETETIHPDMNLEIDLGLDSLARAEVFAALEQAFGREFDAEDAARALTIREIVDLASRGTDTGGKSISAAEFNWGKIVNQETDLPEVMTVLRDRPVFETFVWSVYSIFYVFFKLFLRLEVSGLENLTSLERPFLICPNHQSFLDPFIISSNYPLRIFRHTFHVGASEFFQNAFMRFLANLLNVVPVNPDTQLMRAMKAGAAGLRHGKILNIYPEGERAFDGELHAFKKGASILATELSLPILPVAIDGAYKVWARNSWRIRPAKVKVRFGVPIIAADVPFNGNSSAPENGAAREDHYAAVTARLKDAIAEMIADMRAQS
jgi:long-chain acyl-CoA synthetase